MTSCSLKTADCSAPYSGDKLSIGASYPYAITATSDVLEGWTETVCYECTDGVLTAQVADYVIRQSLSCTVVLEANAPGT